MIRRNSNKVITQGFQKMNKASSARVLSLSLIAALGLSAQSVPPAFQSIYSTLNTQIQSFESTVQAGWNKSPYPTLFTPQLQSASSGEYTQLLTSTYMAYVILPEIEQLQALGATGVTVHIDFPILYAPFYSSNPSQYQQFVSFYQQVAQAVRSRGLKLVVESVVSESLPTNDAQTFASYYAGLSWTAYMAGRAQNAVNVAQLIEPDYMSVIVEPDTEAAVSGQATSGTPAGSLQLLDTILAAMQAANVTNVKVGAGAGTWTVNYNEYLQDFAAAAVDFVDIHVYPINENYFLEALTAADTIHAAGKEVAMSETWPWKVSNTEVGTVSYVTVAARDPFSFWAPIDTSFLQAIVDFSQYKQLTFISPFWTDYFFSYLNYNTYGTYTPGTVLSDAQQAADQAVGIAAFTSTGHAWENSIIPAPDTTRPATPAAPTASGTGTTGVNVSWLATTDNVGVAGYLVYRNGALADTTSGYIFYDKGLVSGATYTYTLAAFDASGNVSALSAPLVVTTINATAPPPPTNVKVTGATSSSVSLSWTASSDISGIAGYRIKRGTSASSLSFVGNVIGPITTYTAVCRPGITYYFEVESYIPNGILSLPSNEVSVTTP